MFVMAEEGGAKVRCLFWQRKAELKCDVCDIRGKWS